MLEEEATSGTVAIVLISSFFLENFILFRRHIFRYHATLLRARFDQNKQITDLSRARALVIAGERENFEKTHPIPKKCKFHRYKRQRTAEKTVNHFCTCLIFQLPTVLADVRSNVKLSLQIGY